MCKIIFQAMAYRHAKNIVHHNLKPENLLLMVRAFLFYSCVNTKINSKKCQLFDASCVRQNKQSDSDIKIADFGFVKFPSNEACLTTQCGAPGYVGIEILEGALYGTMCDMWSLCVIVFIILGGYPSFIEANQREHFCKI